MNDETPAPTAEAAPPPDGVDAAAPPTLPAHEPAPGADVVIHPPPVAASEAEAPAETPAATAEVDDAHELPASAEPVAEADSVPEGPHAEVAEPEPVEERVEVAEAERAADTPSVAGHGLVADEVTAAAGPVGAPTAAADDTPADGAEAAAPAEPPAEPAPPESNKKWYVVKVQSNREESIKAAVERQVKIQGLEEFFGQIVIPTEEYYEKKKVSVKDKKTGQKVTEERNVTKHRKKYPGYLFAEVEFNDRILYVFRETSGVGDFVGATHHRAPSPMPDREVQQMLTGVADPNSKDPKRKVKVKLNFEKGDKVRIREGAFSGSEAEVKAISEPKDPTDSPKVTVVVTIWGRPVEMEMDSFQVDKA